MDAAELRLSQGRVALVDASDLPVLLWRKWNAFRAGRTWYAATNIDGHRLYLHRFLMQPGDRMEVDHINGDGLDNRRSNLRVCTHAENLRNQRTQLGGSSRFRGVTWYTRRQRWHAQIKVEGKHKSLGYYRAEEDAARAYDAGALRLHGEFARLNFPTHSA